VGKLVVLKLGAGTLASGCAVTLQIGDEQAQPTIELLGSLPADPDLVTAWQTWQTLYRQIDFSGRPIGKPGQNRPAPERREQCQIAAQALRQRFNQWLQAPGFRPLREQWLETLQPADLIRVIIQTPDDTVQRLPWHGWDLLERYVEAEIALSAPAYTQARRSLQPRRVIRVLAILGDSQGIDTAADRAFLAQLPQAQVTFLVEPQREALTAQLWNEHWDIFFFAGHSSSQQQTGTIALNATEHLTLGELRYALKTSVGRGLQLAIFNSCDGLGLAREFAELQIPQLIVMREPVPDRVAQAFLQAFLAAFAQGKSLYRAVREARERLQGLEGQFPCATWLPMIFQNPADTPPTWQELLGRTVRSRPRSLRWVLPLVSLGLTAGIMGGRHTGLLQPLELAAYDQILALRPQEPPDSRILVVTVTEADVQSQSQGRGSLSDASLAGLLRKLMAGQPRVIGLDIYRDYPVSRAFPQLAQQLRQSDRIFTVCRNDDPVTQTVGVEPPPEVSADRLGFANFVADADNTIRRHLLGMEPPPNSRCQAEYALSTQLAVQYLASEGINLEFTPTGAWKLGKTVFSPLTSHWGGYQGIDPWGHQLVLNYRNYRSIAQVAPQITLAQALSPQWNAAAVADRIVLIGTTAESFKDFAPTPYFTPTGERLQIPGVMLQAQMVSQLVSAGLTERPLISVLPMGAEWLWVGSWAIVGSVIGARWRLKYCIIGTGIALTTLYGVCVGGLIAVALWLPLVPAAIALLSSAGVILATLPHLPQAKLSSGSQGKDL
jgi:CHASE2 domain-containing sensor protein